MQVCQRGPLEERLGPKRSLVLLRLLLGLLLRSLLLLLGSHRLLLFVEPTDLDEKGTSASPLGNRGGQHPARCACARVPETLVTRALRGEPCGTHSLIRCPRRTTQHITHHHLSTTQSVTTFVAGGLNVERSVGHLFSAFVSLRAHLLFNPSAHTNASLFFLQPVHATLRTRFARSFVMHHARATRAHQAIVCVISRRQTRSRARDE